MYDPQTNVSEGRESEEREEADCQLEVAGESTRGASAKEGVGHLVIIYAIECPISGHVKYVGKTCRPLRVRLGQHRNAKKNRHLYAWLQSLGGAIPSIYEIDRIENSNDEDWQDVERFWITYLRFIGCPLLNLDSGGNGGKRRSDETKAKIGAANRGKVRDAELRARLSVIHTGVKLTEAHKANMSKAIKGKKLGPRPRELVERIAVKQRGKKRPPRTPEHCAKLAEALAGRDVSEETRKKISESQKGKKRGPYSEDHREAISESLKGRSIPSEARENMRASALKRWAKIRQEKSQQSDPCTS